MKKILIIISLSWCSAEAQTPRDTVMLDSTQVEKIHKMPMDTFNSKMPVAPLERDTAPRSNPTRDDADPKRMKDTLRSRNENRP
jgi:hypothetical protein